MLDTDFLIKVANDPVSRLDLSQLASEYTVSTLPSVIAELEGLSQHKERKTARRASNALRIVNQKESKIRIEVLDLPRQGREKVDSALIDLAKREDGATIATMDHSLLSRLERMRLPYLTLSDDKPLLKKFPREQRI